MPLDPPDNFHLRAAEGWLGLGNVAEAEQELSQLSPALRDHPEVLKLKWELLAVERKWASALEIAAALIQIDPEDAAGWVHRSYCLHELKQTTEARDNLLRVVENFPDNATMRYNLACYECQLGRLSQARKWIKKAFAIGDADEMKRAAMADPDLAPLWPELAGLWPGGASIAFS